MMSAKIVIDLQTPVIAVAGNHDSPDRIHFGSSLMKNKDYILQVNFNSRMNLLY